MTFSLAMAIFMSPAGQNDVPPPIKDWPQISMVLRDVAIKMELLDRAESRYILADLKDFQIDINVIRDRYIKCKNYPLSNESNGFPKPNELKELIDFNRGYKNYLDKLIEFGYDVDREIIKELDCHYYAIDNLRDSMVLYYNVISRREYLYKYKMYVGDEAFYSRGEIGRAHV